MLIVVLNLSVNTAGQSIGSGTPLYIQSIGGSSSYGGLLLAVYIVSAIIMRFFAGKIADTRSRKLVLLIGGASIMVGSLLPAIIMVPEAQFPGRILQGIGFASAHTAINACAADILPKKRLGEGLGYFGLGQAVSMAVGPALAVWLVSLDYQEALAVGIGLIGLIIVVLAIFSTYEKHPEKLPASSGYRRTWEERQEKKETVAEAEVEVEKKEQAKGQDRSFFGRLFELAAIYGALPLVFVMLSTTIFVSYTSVYAKTMGYTNPSLFFLAAAIVAIIIRMTSSRFMDKIAPGKLFLVPVIAGIATNICLMTVHNEIAYAFFGIGYGICIGIAIPLLNSVAVKASPPQRYGAANGLFYLFYDVGFGLAAVGWGVVLDYADFNVVFIGGICCQIIAYLISIVLFPKAKKRQLELDAVK